MGFQHANVIHRTMLALWRFGTVWNWTGFLWEFQPRRTSSGLNLTPGLFSDCSSTQNNWGTHALQKLTTPLKNTRRRRRPLQSRRRRRGRRSRGRKWEMWSRCFFQMSSQITVRCIDYCTEYFWLDLFTGKTIAACPYTRFPNASLFDFPSSRGFPATRNSLGGAEEGTIASAAGPWFASNDFTSQTKLKSLRGVRILHFLNIFKDTSGFQICACFFRPQITHLSMYQFKLLDHMYRF